MQTPRIPVALLTLALAVLAACKPAPPATDEPPEPKAAVADATQLRDAIQKPIDQAKAVENTVQEAADKQNAQIEAASQ